MTATADQVGGGVVPGPRPRQSGTAFGLSIDSDVPLSGIHDRRAEHARGHCSIRDVSLDELEAQWTVDATVRVAEQLYTTGATAFAIDHAASAGYRIWSFGFGTYLVEPEGGTIHCVRPAGPATKVERVLVAQALPLSASLQGLEVLHASAVVVDGRAIGLLGASGGGKTTLATQLIVRGHSMFTDDALALAANEEGVLAFPGPTILHLDPTRAVSGAHEPGGEVLGTTDKTHLRVERAEGRPLPLGACYFLDRGTDDREVVIEPIEEDAPRLIMSNAFVRYHRGPDRLMRVLDASAQIAAQVPLFRLRAPTSAGPAELAEALESHVGRTVRA